MFPLDLIEAPDVHGWRADNGGQLDTRLSNHRTREEALAAAEGGSVNACDFYTPELAARICRVTPERFRELLSAATERQRTETLWTGVDVHAVRCWVGRASFRGTP